MKLKTKKIHKHLTVSNISQQVPLQKKFDKVENAKDDIFKWAIFTFNTLKYSWIRILFIKALFNWVNWHYRRWKIKALNNSNKQLRNKNIVDLNDPQLS